MVVVMAMENGLGLMGWSDLVLDFRLHVDRVVSFFRVHEVGDLFV